MRISDWSSDVCSSDLSDIGVHARANGIGEEVADSGFRPSDRGTAAVERRQRFANGDVQLFRELVEVDLHLGRHGSIRIDVLGREDAELDRKSVVEGKSVYVRVDLGCGGSLKKKKKK